MRCLVVLVVAAFMITGCLSTDEVESAPQAEPPAPAESVAPTLIDESFDLLTETVDETWHWTMHENMTGTVRIELEGNPTSTEGGDGICYRLEWPQGHHQGGSLNCSGGNAGITFSSSAVLTSETVYEARLRPNTFTLDIWAPNGPDAAILHVFVETHDA